ncbi:lipoprotein LpqH [Mycolicibacterium brisbanense]|uniref:lipoprotein LpqH n=1 Tax=Mycolicibacterium brisbanense TaxID=146020 RepID=UPI000410CFDA|nr:lipoprotein LpqH [Mycolicibacterium brisbanense]MCV7159117.1 lipoprotein LpqH [Mycolicibacterium brisbanense]
MRHVQRRMRSAGARTVVIAALLASACSAQSGPPAGGNTARITINGQQSSTAFPIDCTQRAWLWIIDSLQKEPGFTAMVETGTGVTPKAVRLRSVDGFTGSWAEGRAGTAEASIDGSTFTITGTASGANDDRPTRPADVQYRLEARC